MRICQRRRVAAKSATMLAEQPDRSALGTRGERTRRMRGWRSNHHAYSRLPDDVFCRGAFNVDQELLIRTADDDDVVVPSSCAARSRCHPSRRGSAASPSRSSPGAGSPFGIDAPTTTEPASSARTRKPSPIRTPSSLSPTTTVAGPAPLELIPLPPRGPPCAAAVKAARPGSSVGRAED